MVAVVTSPIPDDAGDDDRYLLALLEATVDALAARIRREDAEAAQEAPRRP